MTDYTEYIRQTHLVKELKYVLTTGDLGYRGTAVEVLEESDQGVHLFHLVIEDETGEIQVICFSHSERFRLSLAQFKQMIEVAEANVRRNEEHLDDQ